MQDDSVEICVDRLVDQCQDAPLDVRLSMKSDVERVIRTLKSQSHAVPRRLKQLKDQLEEEAYDDLFDNMPV